MSPLPLGDHSPARGPKFVPVPIGGNPSVFPRNSLSEHVADHSDPHETSALVPGMRTGSGAPSVLGTDKATDMYFDVLNAELYVCVPSSGTLVWRKATSSQQVVLPDDVYNKSEVVGGVQHYKRQQVSYDSEMGAWTMTLVGDYVKNADGTYSPVTGG